MIIAVILTVLLAAVGLKIHSIRVRSALKNSGQRDLPNQFQSEIDIQKIYLKNDRPENFRKPTGRKLRILSWNIERGYHPDALAAFILELDPDIICLQEIDWGNRRTGSLDVMAYLAEKTAMTGYFSTEFVEIDTPMRSERLAGGGVHGNGILTRIQLQRCYRMEMPQFYDWESPPVSVILQPYAEKRIGKRFAMGADFQIDGIPLTICCAHLENAGGGVAGRFKQFQVLAEKIEESAPGNGVAIIAGDFNTLDNWQSRLTGYTNAAEASGKPWHVPECRWWADKLLPETGFKDPFSCTDWTLKRGGFYREKLDWVTVKGCEITDQGMGDFNTSDHRPIWADIQL